MYLKHSLRLFFTLFPLIAQADPVQRIQAHQLIGDLPAARAEAEQALSLDSKNAALDEAYIATLAEMGDEKAMLRAWKIYAAKFPDKADNRVVIEDIAWGVLRKATCSSALPIRITGLLAAFFSQDAKGVTILQQAMRDPHSGIRGAAVELAGHYRDAKLKTEIVRLFRQERVWNVRRGVIKAAGSMHIPALRPELEALIASEHSSAEEKALATGALVNLLEDVAREDLVRLASSSRSGLRLVACQAIAHLNLDRDIDQLFILAKDSHADVRAAALQTLGLLRPVNNDVEAVAESSLDDTHPQVALSACWLLTLYDSEKGQEAFKPYLAHGNSEIRRSAAAALAATGRYGVPLAIEYLKTSDDLYVRLNLALGLAGQRLAVEEIKVALYNAIVSENNKWVWEEQGLFRLLSPRKPKGDDKAQMTAEMENLSVRLEILNRLAILQAPQAQEAIKRFLGERLWGLSGMAAVLLLTEGDAAAIDAVESLLDDPNQKVRLQAAWILSLWGKGDRAIDVLQQGYAQANREMKERLLEGLGRIGSMRSVPFLIEVLNEPSQTLRTMAAAALIQCLNS